MGLRTFLALFLVALWGLATSLGYSIAIYMAVGSSLFVTTAAAGVGLFVVFPNWFPAGINKVLSWCRVKGSVRVARASIAWPGNLSLEVETLMLTNPDGFECENLLTAAKLYATISIWSVFSWCISVLRLDIEQVSIFLERKDGLGINAVRYYNFVRHGRAVLEEETEETAKKKADTILALIGALPENILGAVAQRVENSGGVRNFFKESVIGTTNGAMGLLELTGESIKNASDEMQASVKEAGGLSKWAEATVSSTLSAIKDKAADAERRTAEHGLLHGVARTAAEEVKDLAGELTDKASDAVLYEQLHGKIAGCYEEPARGLASLRLNVQSVRVRELQVYSRGLIRGSTEDSYTLAAPEVALDPEDMVPHSRARHQDGIPLLEAIRRLKVMINATIRTENKGTLVRMVHAGLKEVRPLEWVLSATAESTSPEPTDEDQAAERPGAGHSPRSQGAAASAAEPAAPPAKRPPSPAGSLGSSVGSRDPASGRASPVDSRGSFSARGASNAVPPLPPPKLANGSSTADETVLDPPPASRALPRPRPMSKSNSTESFGSGSGSLSQPSRGVESNLTEDLRTAAANTLVAAPKIIDDAHQGGRKVLKGAGEAVSGIVEGATEVAPDVIKNTADLVGGAVSGAGDALSNFTGHAGFQDAGKSLSSAVDGVGGALVGLFSQPDSEQ